MRNSIQFIFGLMAVLGFLGCNDTSDSNRFTLLSPAQETYYGKQNTPVEDSLKGSRRSASSVQFVVKAKAQNGTVEILDQKMGKFRYTPSKDFVGVDHFSYFVQTAASGSQGSDIPVQVLITSSSLPPVADPLELQVDFNTPKMFNLSGRDAQDGVKVSFTAPLPGGPLHGQVSVVDLAQHLYAYTPNPGFRGSDHFEFLVTNSHGQSARAPVNVSVSSALRSLRPALAVRGMGCIMCHGRVNANIVTDFGFGGDGHGLDYFLSQNTSGVSPSYGGIYGDHYLNYKTSNWSTSTVSSQIYVPAQAVVPANTFWTSLVGEASLVVYLKSLINDQFKPTVLGASQVYIGAPSADEIRSAANGMSDSQQWKFLPHSDASLPFSGLRSHSVVSGDDSGSTYTGMENVPGSELVCEGDLIVNAPLKLKDLKIRTDKFGCRIYVTASVFIEGAITYLGTDKDRNLQISSSRAILLGMGPSKLPVLGADGNPACNVNNSTVCRLQGNHSEGYGTREQGKTTTQKLDAIVFDQKNFFPELTDASDHWAQNDQHPSRELSFERLLLNAPIVMSRYKGDFKGAIIAEVALFSLGSFQFDFDTVFIRTSVLPLLPEEKLLVVGGISSDSGN